MRASSSLIPRTFKRNFAAIHDMKVKGEIERLAKEYGKLRRGGAERESGPSLHHKTATACRASVIAMK